MVHVTALAVALFLAAEPAEATRTLKFDDVTYTRAFVSQNDTDHLAEYVPPGETVDDWTKLVAVRVFGQLDDPAQVIDAFAKTLMKTNPLARYKILVKDDKSEAMIDFLTWPEDGSYMEFNVFRYLKRPGQDGLVCYQFAHRFSDTSPESLEKFKQNRQRWVDEMAKAELPIDFEE